MASYLPHHQAPRLWQSDAPTPGPVRRGGFSPTSTGSRRSYAPTKTGSVNFARSGAALQSVTGQYGNYLLYRDQVRHANAMMEDRMAKEEGKAVNQAAGTAIEAMLGGVAKKSRKGGKGGNPPSLGSPRTGTPLSTSPSTPGSGPVGPSPKLPSQEMDAADTVGAPVSWAKADTMGSLSPFMASMGAQARQPMQRELQGQPSARTSVADRGFKRPGLAGPVLDPSVGAEGQMAFDFGRPGYQPPMNPGNTMNPQSTRTRDRRARRPGGNFSNIDYGT